MVHSRPSQGDFRTAVRETWGGREAFEAVGVRPLFFLGRSTDPEGDLAGPISDSSKLKQSTKMYEKLSFGRALNFNRVQVFLFL